MILGFVTLWAAKNGIGFEELPSFEELENPKSNLATEIYSSDGKLLGKYFKENRVNVRYKDLSPYLVNGLVATEDERFYKHSGIDVRGLTRAVVNLGRSGGASTITQQLAKMLFHERATSTIGRIKQKLQEWILAVELEKRYTKEEIITMYLNRFDFINNAVGIKSATNVYFNKEPHELNIQEAAMLVGMAKNPSLFNPLRRPEMTKDRRNVVLYQMKRNNYITEAQYDSLKQLPLTLDYKIVDHKEGLAPYFREVLRDFLSKKLEEKDKEGNYIYHKKDGSPYNLYKDGLKVYTTIDSRMQAYAEFAVSEHLSKNLQKAFFKDLKGKKKAPFDFRVSNKQIEQIMEAARKRTERYNILTGKQCANCGRRGKYVKKIGNYYQCQAEDCGFKRWATSPDSIPIIFDTPVKMKVFSWRGEIDTTLSPNDSIKYYKSFLQAGLMSLDPHTGYIKAWVGGINFKHFAYDHVMQSKRQVGSTFKPIVYSVAIQNGMSPCYEVPNVKTCFDMPPGQPDYCPKNSENDYGYMVSLKYGLANSMNTVTAWVLKQFGPQAVVDQARAMGIKSHLDPVPSLCLGVADLSVYELVGANSTFANKGVWIEPTFVTRVEDKFGNVIIDFVPESKEAMSEEAAYVMLDMMKGVVDGVYNKHKNKSTGTGMRLRGTISKDRPYVGHRYPIAGKTGTTQNNSDGWFVGLTPDLVTGVWVGADDRSIRFTRTYYGQGANSALPIWGYYMQKVYADSSIVLNRGDFEKPEQPLSIEIDCKKYNQENNTNLDYQDY
ncbi:MAG: transglycosylase domain-containing protein [Vicingaceae bacterium]